MSSFGTLITASVLLITAVLILGQWSYMMRVGIEMYNEGLEAIKHSISLERTAIRILEVVPQNNTTIYVKIKNVGSYSIPVAQFDMAEIFVIGTLVNHTYPTVIRIPFDQLSTKEEGWRVLSISTNGVVGEVLNPIDLSSASSGRWDPSEELLIMTYMSGRHALNLTYPVNVVFVAPNGASTAEVNFGIER
ncbi:MAG: hypothetical protein RMJ14_04410 [Nitrososphaerota archaeon]|nr:hypothetical protein [Aigarchaeota archaeon]MDW8076861.1 hypothetical protein [Nitrososphaerota archaeon]